MKETIFSLARRKGLGELAEAGTQMVAGKDGIQKIRDCETGESKWMVYAPVKSTGWSLAAIIPEKEVMSSVYARLFRLLSLLGAGLIAIFGIVVLVSARITHPIRRVALAAESLGRGSLEVRVEGVSGKDEIACLARTFNAMAADLQDNIDCRIKEEASRKEIEGELNAARNIQASLLPAAFASKPEDKFSLHAINLPAKSVAGDFYDFFFLDDRRLVLVIADVSGKGIPAAMYMAVTRTKLRDFASPEKSPAEVLAAVNCSLVQENEQEMFVSIFLGYYDIVSGELVYANAGHNPPYLIQQNGQIKTLEPTGPLVAVFPEANFETTQCRLETGDLIVLFTDGITEADQKGNLFGEKRLENLLQSSGESQPEDVCRNIIASAIAFSGGDLSDDATVLVLKRKCPVE